MSDRLPDICIAVDEPTYLLYRASVIAKNFCLYSISAPPKDLRFDGSALNFRMIQSSSHAGLGFQLINFRDSNKRIDVEIRAERWVPDASPSYETYVAAAQTMVAPIIKAFNREEKTRYRMTITPKKKLEPTLPQISARYFERFTSCANKNCLHPRDWERFYAFVRFSRARFSSDDLTLLLVKSGFKVDYARHIAEIYAHLKDFAKARTPINL